VGTVRKVSFSKTRSRLGGIVAVSVAEGTAVYLWLRLDEAGSPVLGFAILVVGELLETLIVAVPLARNKSPIPVGDPYGARAHQRRFQRRFLVASVGELAIWYGWLQLALEVDQWVAAAALLVTMHLKHQLEAATVRDVSYWRWTWRDTIASAAEAGGAAGCLALILAGEPWLAAAALAGGFLIEHVLLMYSLYHALEERDIGVPRARRPPMRLLGRFVEFAGKRGRWVWRLLQAIGPVERFVNRRAINALAGAVGPRPNPLSTLAPYTSWESLTNREYSGRYLGPSPSEPRCFPSVAEVAELFRRRGDGEPCPKSSALFPAFAQWFVDGFLRTERDSVTKARNTLRNESNHDIDLSPLYGLDHKMTLALRAGRGGRLRSQTVNGEEFPEYLCHGWCARRRPQFDVLPEPLGFKQMTREQKRLLFAMGTDVHNLGFTAFNVLFLREHNRIADELLAEYPGWDNDRLFETARNILIVVLMKLIVEDYINHITGYHFQFRFPGKGTFATAPWFRPNWMAVEFNLLYRWHPLLPRTQRVGARYLTVEETRIANDVLIASGMREFMLAASDQRAGRIGLFNTDPHLVTTAEVHTITQGRIAQLLPYNDYRDLCRLPRVRHFGQFSSDERIGERLHALYQHVDNVEFYVGLFAEELGRYDLLPPLMTTMVAFDAFSQVLTNPLLAPRVFGPQTFSAVGMKIIDDTRSIEQVIRRNVPYSHPDDYFSLTRAGYDGA
jgi:prostaglandin-endoperoxide synthase 2